MYFVCPGCSKTLRVPAEKVPPRPVRYACKSCGLTSSLQENLHAERPAKEARDESLPEGLASNSSVGTVFHHVSNLGSDDVPSARFSLDLEVRGGDDSVRAYRFDEAKVVVGRKGADVVVSDPLVSRNHVEFERVRETVLLKDLGSTNGTYLNEKKVTAGVVGPEDEIRVGNVVMKVKVRIT